MKTVLVTGGTTRLGQAISEGLRRRGWRVLTSSHRPDAGADIVADLSESDAAERLFTAACAKAGGALDAIVNNAALYVADAATLSTVNLASPRRLTALLARQSVTSASVVNIVDAKALGEAEDPSPYLETKLALVAATREDARRFAATLRVNAVAPGPVLAPAAVHEKAARTVLARRPVAEDVAEAVTYLLDALAVTGVVVPVDAGQHLLNERKV